MPAKFQDPDFITHAFKRLHPRRSDLHEGFEGKLSKSLLLLSKFAGPKEQSFHIFNSYLVVLCFDSSFIFDYLISGDFSTGTISPFNLLLDSLEETTRLNCPNFEFTRPCRRNKILKG